MTTRTSHGTGWLVSVLTHSLAAGIAGAFLISEEVPAHPEIFEMRITVASPAAVPPPVPDSIRKVPAPPQRVAEPEQAPRQTTPVQRQAISERTVVSREPVEARAVSTPAAVARESVPVAHAQDYMTAAVTEQPFDRQEVVQRSGSVVQQGEVARSEVVTTEAMESLPSVADSFPVTQHIVAQYSRAVASPVEARQRETSPTPFATTVQPMTTTTVIQRDLQADFGWLSAALRERIEALKRYPSFAKSRKWEGKVVIEADISESGDIVRVQVAESSGHTVLDDEAMAVVRKSSPVPLRYELGQSFITIRVPIVYKLNT
jgi:periplasmic protein TonB